MARQVVLRGIREMIGAPWTSTGNYGTSFDISGVREGSLELELETDQLEGDDEVIDRYSRVIAVNVSFQQGRVDLEAASELTGGTFDTGADYDQFLLDGENDPPYIGLAFKVRASDGKEVHYFLPKTKLSGNLSLTAAYGSYTIPQAEFQAIKDGAQGMLRVRNFDGPATLSIPLATAAD